MIWFDHGQIPPGQWPFLTAVRAGLVEIESSLADQVDMSEGGGEMLITGCLAAYRQAVMCRVLDLAQGVISCWNAGQQLASIACGRALLETIAIYHSLLARSQALAANSDWRGIESLVDGYALSSSSGKRELPPSADPPGRIGKLVVEFIAATNPGSEQFWHEICDTAHPNGRRMLQFAGKVQGNLFVRRRQEENASGVFRAVYNCLYSCCWLIASDLDFDILLEHIRTGMQPSKDHHLMVRRDQVDRLTKDAVSQFKVQPGEA